jgi:hypothetical protein
LEVVTSCQECILSSGEIGWSIETVWQIGIRTVGCIAIITDIKTKGLLKNV